MTMFLNYLGVFILIYLIITGIKLIVTELKEIGKKSKK